LDGIVLQTVEIKGLAEIGIFLDSITEHPISACSPTVFPPFFSALYIILSNKPVSVNGTLYVILKLNFLFYLLGQGGLAYENALTHGENGANAHFTQLVFYSLSVGTVPTYSSTHQHGVPKSTSPLSTLAVLKTLPDPRSKQGASHPVTGCVAPK